MIATATRVPCAVVTGFPGHGKTTLIRLILRPLPAGIGNLRANTRIGGPSHPYNKDRPDHA